MTGRWWFKTGDTVFMYVAVPVSAILYQCKVMESDIPYDYADKDLTIKALMWIKLVKRFPADRFTFDVLKKILPYVLYVSYNICGNI